jgi:hypothetical protein
VDDEPNEVVDKKQPEYDSEDAEAPFVTHVVIADPGRAHRSEKHYTADNYVKPALRRIRTGWLWIWDKTLSNSQFWMAAATIVMAVSTAIYTHYVSIEIPEIKKSADAAKDAALAAKQSADTQNQSYQMERRRAEDQEEAICRLHTGMAALDNVGHVYLANSGKTKARNVEARVDTYLADATTLKKLRQLGSVDISTSELEKDQSLDRGVNLPLTAHDWDNLADTNVVIIDSGRIRYENGFGRIVDEAVCDGWWYFRAPEDKLNPVQGRGNECGQIPQSVAGIKKQKAK